jgi:23S rRNA (cytidine1920-2'-O)/16S rRNA (cytidine1409-2'-O)-methyltransferase
LAIDRVRESVSALRGEDLALISSPIDGAEGNREFLLYASFPA